MTEKEKTKVKSKEETSDKPPIEPAQAELAKRPGTVIRDDKGKERLIYGIDY